MSFVLQRRRALVACVAGWTCALGGALAQAPVVVEPPAILLPNYGRVLIGSQGAMEGGALLVRAKATEAAWYNPAGVVRSRHPTFMANASLYDLTTCTFEAGETAAASSNLATLPSFVGKTGWISERPGEHGKLAWGYTIATPVSWESNVDSYEDLSYPDATYDWTSRITANSHTKFDTLAVGGVLSYAVTPAYAEGRRLTIGAAANLYNTTLDVKRSVFDDRYGDEIAGPDTVVRTGSLDYDFSSTTMQLGLTLGMYARLAGRLECAVILRSPGIKLTGSGSLDEHELVVQDAALPGDEYTEQDAHVAGADVDFKVPMELGVGVAYNGDKLDAEIDFNYHAGTGSYTVFSAYDYISRIGALAAPVETLETHSSLQATGEPILDIALGWRYELVADKNRLHGGFRTCLSPVDAANDDFFHAVDLYVLTLGYSSQTENTFTSLGVSVGFGPARDYSAEDMVSGGTVDGSLSVTTFGFFMGASFKL
jgi:hypothetical protein